MLNVFLGWKVTSTKIRGNQLYLYRCYSVCGSRQLLQLIVEDLYILHRTDQLLVIKQLSLLRTSETKMQQQIYNHVSLQRKNQDICNTGESEGLLKASFFLIWYHIGIPLSQFYFILQCMQILNLNRRYNQKKCSRSL